jgi:hypothetical protein
VLLSLIDLQVGCALLKHQGMTVDGPALLPRTLLLLLLLLLRTC